MLSMWYQTWLTSKMCKKGKTCDVQSHPVHKWQARCLDMELIDSTTCRLNWQLHFGEPPKWAAGVKFILADVAPGQRDSEKAAITLTGDAGAVAAQLSEALESATGFDATHYQDWTEQLTEKVLHLLSRCHNGVEGISCMSSCIIQPRVQCTQRVQLQLMPATFRAGPSN